MLWSPESMIVRLRITGAGRIDEQRRPECRAFELEVDASQSEEASVPRPVLPGTSSSTRITRECNPPASIVVIVTIVNPATAVELAGEGQGSATTVLELDLAITAQTAAIEVNVVETQALDLAVVLAQMAADLVLRPIKFACFMGFPFGLERIIWDA